MCELNKIDFVIEEFFNEPTIMELHFQEDKYAAVNIYDKNLKIYDVHMKVSWCGKTSKEQLDYALEKIKYKMNVKNDRMSEVINTYKSDLGRCVSIEKPKIITLRKYVK